VETKVNYIIVGSNPGDNACDTMNYPLPGTEVLYSVLYQNGTMGYISGNNGYSDMAKAEYIVPASPYIKLQAAYFKFGKARKRPSDNVPVVFAAWDASGPGGTPGATPLTTDTIPIATIVTQVNTHQMTLVQFNPPVNITGPFFLGVYLPEIGGDTLAVLTNKNGESFPGTAWEQWQNGLWYRYSDSLSWGYNLSHAIFPIMCKQDFGLEGDLTEGEVVVYPNPANGSLTIDFGYRLPANIEIRMYDLMGKLCEADEYQGDPIQRKTLDVSAHPAGIYFLNIVADGVATSRKISLVH
jgi:hypothetical protein